MKLIDLDQNPQTIVTFTLGGTLYAYSRANLVAALGLAEPTIERKSQASVGKAVSWLLADIEEGKITSQRETRQRLAAILESFDGTVSTPSRIGSLLVKITKTAAGITCGSAVLDFFVRYPKLAPTDAEGEELAKIPGVASTIKNEEIDDVEHLRLHDTETQFDVGKVLIERGIGRKRTTKSRRKKAT